MSKSTVPETAFRRQAFDGTIHMGGTTTNMDNVKHFLNGIKQNETLAQQLREATSKEDVLGIAKAHGYDLSEDDLQALGRLARARDKVQAEGELSDEELLMINGGFFMDPIRLIDEVALAADYYIFRRL
jgi:predicted ribosomally synthesized peptide with nif11-like leader